MNKQIIAASVLTTGLFATAASADIINIGIDRYDTTVGFWKLHTLQQQDKLWNIVGADLSANVTDETQVSFTFNPIAPGQDVHTLFWSPIGEPTNALPQTYSMHYTIEMTPAAAAAGVVFAAASVGVDTTGFCLSNPTSLCSEAVKTLNGSLVISASQGANGITPIGGTLIDVVETVQWNSAPLVSVSNSFLETNVPLPEPTTLTLFGLGLAGLGARARKSRKG
jgi:hypothetical protein